jgi:uncharacterized HAD superfamily protein
MKKFNLCIDIDGTVTEPFYWLKKANEYFKTEVQPEDVTEYEIHEILNISEKDYMDFYDQYGIALHSEAELRLGANEMIKRLHHTHNIHFVTAREEKYTDTSIEWLQRYEFPFDTITHLGHHNKVESAKQLKADFFIEDSYNNAVQLADAGFKVLLIDCNYNRKPTPLNVIRVGNWLEIIEEINKNNKTIMNEFKFA